MNNNMEDIIFAFGYAGIAFLTLGAIVWCCIFWWTRKRFGQSGNKMSYREKYPWVWFFLDVGLGLCGCSFGLMCWKALLD